MRRQASLCALAFLLLPAGDVAAAAALAPARAVDLAPGASHSVRLPGKIARLHVLDPQVADVVSVRRRGFAIVALKPGTTEIHVHLTSRKVIRLRVRVANKRTSRLHRWVVAYLGQVPGLVVRRVGDKVVIEGVARSLPDYTRAMRARRLFGPRVVPFVRYSQRAVRELQGIFRRAGLTGVRARPGVPTKTD